ncbi:hypothetical protein [Microbacterium paludicola]|uniref:hypothetical protein n=1 Tax=Microbacterium paludicola TaxID=300019 RepID=UPI0011A8B550|nr:hypothetical protein [Microbacterium paludicola]
MPAITGPILDSSGRPANGYLRVRASRPFDSAGSHITEARGVARVVNGVPVDTGGAWSLPPTPEGVYLTLVQDLDGDQLQEFNVIVPERQTMTYSELLFNRGGAGTPTGYVWVIESSEPIPAVAVVGDVWVESDTGNWGVITNG